MSLAPFSIIVAIDASNGIAKDGTIPWSSRADLKFFRDVTFGKGRNAVIMGRITYESIPPAHRPLEGRRNVIISRTWKQEDHPEVLVFASLLDALIGLGANMSLYDEVVIAGGEQIYAEAIRDFLYLCQKIHVTRFKTDYDCDQFFPYDSIKDMRTASDPAKMRDYTRYLFLSTEVHPEFSYLNLMSDILEKGEIRPDRTGVGTHAMFGKTVEYDITERIPIFTTKKVNHDAVIKELLFFISGCSDTKRLEEQGVAIWKGNTSREYLDKNKLSKLQVGDMGPGYSHQWRHWGAEYEGCDADYTGKGVDQLRRLIDGLREDPHSRRHILSSWNVGQLDQMALAPCHILAQFNVSTDRKYLDCMLYQRSADMFLGVPFNVAAYAVLTWMIGHVTGLRPRRLIHVMGDAHVYSNHADSVKRQVKRMPRPFPHLKFRRATKIKELDDFTFDDFIIEGYTSWPYLKGEMAV